MVHLATNFIGIQLPIERELKPLIFTLLFSPFFLVIHSGIADFFFINWTGSCTTKHITGFPDLMTLSNRGDSRFGVRVADDIDHESLFGSTPKRIRINSDPNQNLDSICFSVSISKQNFALACVCDKKLTKFLDAYLWSIPFKFRST